MADKQHHKVSVDDQGIARLTLARAEVHNAMDDAFVAALYETLDELAQDTKVRVLRIDAEGKSFSAGADLRWMRRMATAERQENIQDAAQLEALMRRLDTFPHPTIAVVQGAALGGGVGLVACADIALASTAALFSLSEVRLGLVPSVISPFVLRAIGPRAARRYFLTGERLSAEQARSIGLIHEALPPERLIERAGEIIGLILEGGPKAQKTAKKLVSNLQDGWEKNEIPQKTAELIADLRAGNEAQEGMDAFFHKRKPSWVKEHG